MHVKILFQRRLRKKMIKEVLLYLWQLPQNLLGLLVIFFSKAKKDNSYNVYITNCRIGVSLGKYIILNKHYSYNIILHEQGHQKQSLYFGWLYLIIIGIPSSIFVNLWDRIFHKKWTYQERIKWYYSRYPERWADKLGGVIRS